MIEGEPDEAELATYGLTLADIGDTAVELWPDTRAAIELFIALGTQWRFGPGGAAGLDYGVLPTVMRLQGIPRARQGDVFDDLRVMENEALSLFAKERK